MISFDCREFLYTYIGIGKAPNNGNIQITTKSGAIKGIASTESESHKFFNVPYAEPPINELRWRPTVPLKHGWTSIYNATQFIYIYIYVYYKLHQDSWRRTGCRYCYGSANGWW